MDIVADLLEVGQVEGEEAKDHVGRFEVDARFKLRQVKGHLGLLKGHGVHERVNVCQTRVDVIALLVAPEGNLRRQRHLAEVGEQLFRLPLELHLGGLLLSVGVVHNNNVVVGDIWGLCRSGEDKSVNVF